MKVAALITWLITALGGFYLIGTWLSRGGIRQQQSRTSRFPAPVIFGHFLLAATGLIVVGIIAPSSRPAPASSTCSPSRSAPRRSASRWCT